MNDRSAFRLIPGGAACASATRRLRGRERPAHLRLIAEDVPDRDMDADRDVGGDADRDHPIRRGREALRPLRRPVDVALRLAIWAEAARAAGDVDRADRLCLMAWDAYDRPVRDPASKKL